MHFDHSWYLWCQLFTQKPWSRTLTTTTKNLFFLIKKKQYGPANSRILWTLKSSGPLLTQDNTSSYKLETEKEIKEVLISNRGNVTHELWLGRRRGGHSTPAGLPRKGAQA